MMTSSNFYVHMRKIVLILEAYYVRRLIWFYLNSLDFTCKYQYIFTYLYINFWEVVHPNLKLKLWLVWEIEYGHSCKFK